MARVGLRAEHFEEERLTRMDSTPEAHLESFDFGPLDASGLVDTADAEVGAWDGTTLRIEGANRQPRCANRQHDALVGGCEGLPNDVFPSSSRVTQRTRGKLDWLPRALELEGAIGTCLLAAPLAIVDPGLDWLSLLVVDDPPQQPARLESNGHVLGTPVLAIGGQEEVLG